MSRPPFHRRVFLWAFILAFAVVAPAVVFYTAGYRWNAKKGIIERNGTLIVDTRPNGADVFLNGDKTGEQTPVTLQNIPPGTYRIRLERAGSLSWEKVLDIRPERVTFVNDLRLWRATDPSLLEEGDMHGLSMAPNGRFFAAVIRDTQKNASLVFEEVTQDGGVGGLFGGDQQPIHLAFFDQEPEGDVQIRWNDASSAVLVRDASGHVWLGERSGQRANATRLPDGPYRWEGATLIGIRPGERVEYGVGTDSVQRRNLAVNVIDEEGSFRLVQDPSSGKRSVVEQGHDSRRLELPDGAWIFAGRVDGWLFLTDDRTWLAFDPGARSPQLVQMPSEGLPAGISRERDEAILARSGGELWLTVLGEAPQLLIRTSDALTGAVWHRDGNDVIYATSHDVVAVGLDPRGGRSQTTLATFQTIRGISIMNETLFVSGERDGRSGIWTLPLE